MCNENCRPTDKRRTATVAGAQTNWPLLTRSRDGRLKSKHRSRPLQAYRSWRRHDRRRDGQQAARLGDPLVACAPSAPQCRHAVKFEFTQSPSSDPPCLPPTPQVSNPRNRCAADSHAPGNQTTHLVSNLLFQSPLSSLNNSHPIMVHRRIRIFTFSIIIKAASGRRGARTLQQTATTNATDGRARRAQLVE
jgi:hypothetical protein